MALSGIVGMGTHCGHWCPDNRGTHGRETDCHMCELPYCRVVFVDTAAYGPLPITHADKAARLRHGEVPTMQEAQKWMRRSRLLRSPSHHDCSTWLELLRTRRNQVYEAAVLRTLSRWAVAMIRARYRPSEHIYGSSGGRGPGRYRYTRRRYGVGGPWYDTTARH